jgi:hypothetical protein
VDPGPAEGDQILAYCHLLLSRPELATALGQRARTFVATEHHLARSAEGYAHFLAKLYGWPTPIHHRSEPLWRLIDADPTSVTPPAPTPPTAPADDPVATPLVQAAARAASELGFGQNDTALLRVVARRIAELVGRTDRGW